MTYSHLSKLLSSLILANLLEKEHYFFSNYYLQIYLYFHNTTHYDCRSLIDHQSTDRGAANHGRWKIFLWDGYQSATHQKYDPLRVINASRNRDLYIHCLWRTQAVSYQVYSQSNDSLGNVKVLKRGDIQMTSVGPGTSDAEHANGDSDVHFLQI